MESALNSTVVIVNFDAARCRLLEKLLEVFNSRQPPELDTEIQRNIRAAMTIEALRTFAVELNPTHFAQLKECFDDLDLVTLALVEGKEEISHRPQYVFEVTNLQAAASAAITILLREKTMSEPDARRYVAQKLRAIGTKIYSDFGPVTLKNWRSDVAGDPKDCQRRRVYEADLRSWDSEKGRVTPQGFVDAILAKAAQRAGAALPSR